MSVWIIIPTYDEADNLEPLVAAVRAAMKGVPSVVLIVDDASPDGTGAIADRLAAAHADVRVLHRWGRQGLAAAYRAGFGLALAAGADHVLEMDADFSHDPADLPRLLAAAHAGADVVIGSRYVHGGGVDGWSARRRILSRAGCAYARAVLGSPIRDLTGGFKCFRADALRPVALHELVTVGFAFQVEMTFRAERAGLRVEEVPIVFHERRAGRSKMSAAIAAEAMWRIPVLRLAAQPRGDAWPAGRSTPAAPA